MALVDGERQARGSACLCSRGGRRGKRIRQPLEVGEDGAREPVLLARARRRASGTLVLGTGTPRPSCPSARLWVQGQEFPTLFGTPYGSNIPAP